MPRIRSSSVVSIVCCVAMPLPASLIASFPASAVAPVDTVAKSDQGDRPDPAKVLRNAFEVAETSFDPQRISDVYSNIVNGAMFDTPLRYDYLARPMKLIPNTMTALPTVSADGLTYTFHIKPGTYFD
ncbi:MAG: hypothetical protein AAB319_11535, partial [Pseudomonadota bacterium]